jgi:hypothetical protein
MGLLLVTQNLIFLDTFIYKSINNKVNNNINLLKDKLIFIFNNVNI